MNPRIKKGISSLLFLFILILFPLYAIAVTPNSLTLPKGLKGDGVGLALEENRGILLVGKRLILFDSASGKELSHHKFGLAERPLRLDLADVDGDGRLKAAVTSISNGRISSYIIKIEDSGLFETFLENLPYYFRTIRRGEEKVLIGQLSSDEFPFAGAIHELSWNGKRLKRGKKLDLPSKIGIYQFAISAEGDGKVWVRDDGGRLKLFEKRGRKWKLIYKTSDRYRGGVNCYFAKEEDVMTENIEETVCISTPPIVYMSTRAQEHKNTRAQEHKSTLRLVRPEPVEGLTRSGQARSPFDSFAQGRQDFIIVDRHDFLLGGVILKPGYPRKAFVDLLTFSDEEGMKTCKEWGAYQGWIGDVVLRTEAEKASDRLIILRNSSDKYIPGLRLDQIDISNIDCSGEM